MSRYRIDSDKYLIHVGYDQPLSTFFTTVEDLSLPESDCLVLWVGTLYNEIPDLNQLYIQLFQYTSIPDKIILQLDKDS